MQPHHRIEDSQDIEELERERRVEAIADKMDKPITVLGILFLLLALADPGAGSNLRPWFDAATWTLWAIFVGEFLLRWYIAPSRTRFLRRNWWQVLFLAVPFLRFLRVAGRLARLRPARLGRLLSSAVRGLRATTKSLSSRVAWLGAVTAIVILISAQLLFEFAGYDSYPDALHDAAYSAVSGQPIGGDHALAQVLELVLALYAVIVFAFLAGTLGAYLLERDRDKKAEQAAR